MGPNPAHQQNMRVAIKSHRLVHLVCADGRGPRLFAPHAIFTDIGGKLCAFGYELSTPRSPMTEQASRSVTLDQITGLSLTSYRFSPHPTFSSTGRKLGGVVCAVDRV